MILFANGCSYTWGGGLEPFYKLEEERLSILWPHHLGQMIGASKVINLGLGCGSNQRIVRTTFDWFLREYDKSEEVIAVIQLTDPARYEYYVTDDVNDFSNASERWARLTASALLSPFEKHHDDVKYRRNKRLLTYTTIEGMYKMVSDMSALANLFERYKAKYIFWPGATMIPTIYPKEYLDYLKTLNMVNMDYSWNYNTVSEKDHHPGIEGHKQIAKLLFDIIKP